MWTDPVGSFQRGSQMMEIMSRFAVLKLCEVGYGLQGRLFDFLADFLCGQERRRGGVLPQI